MSNIHKFSIRQRLFAIVLAFCIPIGVLFFFVNKGFEDIIGFAQGEIYGNELQLTAVPVLDKLTSLKLALHKNSNSSDIISSLDKSFTDLESAFNKYETKLQFDQEGLAKRDRENLDIKNVLATWSYVKETKSQEKLNELFGLVRGLIAHSGDTSGLILDPDLDSYYKWT